MGATPRPRCTSGRGAVRQSLFWKICLARFFGVFDNEEQQRQEQQKVSMFLLQPNRCRIDGAFVGLETACVRSVAVELALWPAALHRIVLEQHGGASQDRLVAKRQRLSWQRRPTMQSKQGGAC